MTEEKHNQSDLSHFKFITLISSRSLVCLEIPARILLSSYPLALLRDYSQLLFSLESSKFPSSIFTFCWFCVCDLTSYFIEEVKGQKSALSNFHHLIYPPVCLHCLLSYICEPLMRVPIYLLPLQCYRSPVSLTSLQLLLLFVLMKSLFPSLLNHSLQYTNIPLFLPS